MTKELSMEPGDTAMSPWGASPEPREATGPTHWHAAQIAGEDDFFATLGYEAADPSLQSATWQASADG